MGKCGLPGTHLAKDAIDLLGMDFERTVRPNDELGESDLFFDGPLSLESLADLLLSPTAFGQPLFLDGFGAGRTKNMIKPRFGARFEQQRNHHDAFSRAGRGELLDL